MTISAIYSNVYPDAQYPTCQGGDGAWTQYEVLRSGFRSAEARKERYCGCKAAELHSCYRIIARIVAVGLPHHITQRGNYRQKVFLDDDRIQYLSWIQEYSNKYSLSILAFCLMSNHVHFIAIPNKEESLAKTFNVAHMRYA